jgi:hypothetical protein
VKNGDTLICSECERLWSIFQRATQEHQHLLSRLKSESAPSDKAGAAALIQQINAADLLRKKTRDLLETHQIASGHQ